MQLNNYSYLHVKIRKLCQALEYLTDMKLITDFKDFEDVRFMNKLSYLTIDYKHHVCFSMSHRITKKEQEIIEEIMIYLDFIETVRRYQSIHK